MTSSEPAESPARAAFPDAEQRLRQDIEDKRDQLGDTVEALAAKADVKLRAQAWVAERVGWAKSAAARGRATADRPAETARDRLAATTTQDRQQAAAAAVITLIAGYLVTRRWRKR